MGPFLLCLGIVAIAIGAVDPIEGAFLIFPGSLMLALAVYKLQTKSRKLAYAACGLVFAGFASVMLLSVLGGFGGNAPIFHSQWWGLLCVPYYPLGLDLAFAAATWTVIEITKGTTRIVLGSLLGVVLCAEAAWQAWILSILLRLG